jgi:hypothetical protein
MNTMKATLETRMRNASDKLAAIGQKALKHPVSSILSLCVLAVCGATIAMYSQETGEKPAAVETTGTMPATRTITDTKGRSMDGTIVSKTEDAIKFRRATDNREFDIQLDTLSEADRTFIAGLAAGKEPEALADPNKTSVLFVVDYNFMYEESSDTIQWLRAAGYDVTLGMIFDDYTLTQHRERTKTPETEKLVFVNPWSMMDQFDIVWFKNFSFSKLHSGHDHISLLTHRSNQGGTIVIHCHPTLANKRYFSLDYKGERGFYWGEENYVRSTENWIFYADHLEPTKTEKTRNEVMRRVLNNVKTR